MPALAAHCLRRTQLWILYLLKLLESFAYFSLSYVLVLYLSEEFGYSDVAAGWVYGFFGMLISVYGVLVGFIIDQLGVKLSLVFGSVLLLISRFVIAVTHSNAVLELMLLVVLPVGEAFGVPVRAADQLPHLPPKSGRRASSVGCGQVMLVALRRYTDDSNRRQAFSLFYVVMNTGTLLSAPAVDIFRLAISDGVTLRIAGDRAPAAAACPSAAAPAPPPPSPLPTSSSTGAGERTRRPTRAAGRGVHGAWPS